MSSLLQDIRYAFRVLRKNPGFAIMAILTLALGVGANTAIFSVVNAVLLRPLDFKSPGNLYVLSMEDVKKNMTGGNFGYIFYQALRDHTPNLEGIAAFTNDTFNLVGGDAPEQIQALRVSPSFFDVLGIHPSLGRTFLKPEGEPGGQPVVILGHDFWTRRFGGDPNLVGRNVTLDGTSFTVVGILGRELDVPFQQVDVWVPRPYETSIFPAERVQTGSGYLNAVARTKPGVPVGQAKAELDASAHQYEHAFPANSDASFDTTINVQPISENALGGVRTTLWVLLGAVGFVLLIVCANVANLFLARAAGRQKEIAIRSALGASRSRLVRQFLTESTILAVTGGAIGVVIAAWGVRLLVASPALGMPRSNEVAVNGAVLIFSLGISFLAGILFGIVPAWRTSRINLSEIMNEASRGSSAAAAPQPCWRAHRYRRAGFLGRTSRGRGPFVTEFLPFAARAFGIRAAECSDLSNRSSTYKISAAVSENRISPTTSRTHRHHSRCSLGSHRATGSTVRQSVRAVPRRRNAARSSTRPASNCSLEFHQPGLFSNVGNPDVERQKFFGRRY